MHLPVTSDSQGNVEMTEELSKDSLLKYFVLAVKENFRNMDYLGITAGHIHQLHNLFVVTSLQLQCDIFHSTYGQRCQSEFQAILYANFYSKAGQF